MNVYVSHSGIYDFESELYKPLKDSELYTTHTIFLPHEPENIDIPAKEVLARTDLVVAEVSYPSTGQGIELGLASAADVPILCFYKEGSRPSSSLRFITNRVIGYTTHEEFLEKLKSELSDS